MNKKELGKLVQHVLSEASLFTDGWEILNDTDVWIRIEDGDWKHDHMYLRSVMRENGFEYVSCKQIDNEDDETINDWYTGEYIFRYKN